MSGFSTIIGFMFSFLVIITVFFSAFHTYEKQIIIKSEMLADLKKPSATDINFNFDINNPYFASGRINFYLENTGNNLIKYSSSSTETTIKIENNCYDFYLNNQYLSKENTKINPIKPINTNYNIIEQNSLGIITLKSSYNISIQNELKTISCEGKEDQFYSEIGKENWWNKNWLNRKRITFTNNAATNLIEYQAEIDLNESNFDFSNKKEDIRFLLPIEENLALDLTFDTYSQTLNEYSKNSLNTYLGTNSGIEGTDPVKSEEGIIFSALKFDGVNDYVSVPADTSLELENQITYSAWVKWDQTGGNTIQSIIANGGPSNAIGIINDGGIYDKKVFFAININSVQQYIYSNSTIDDNWHHIVATYDEENASIYIDGKLENKTTLPGTITATTTTNYIGSASNAIYFFNGIIDEVKIFNIALTQNEIQDLINNNLRFRELDFYISNWDKANKKAKIFTKLPYIHQSQTINFEMYYNNNINPNLESNSDIKNTFSYIVPRTMGYVVSDKIAGTTGITLLSLYDNNNITIGSNSYILDKHQGTTIASGNVNINDKVKMKFLGNVEGNGNVDDIIIPISWASTNFYYGGFRNNNDRFCMLSPWGNANVNINDAGVNEWSGVVTQNGFCVTNNINTMLVLTSDIPILVSYSGSDQDSWAFLPPTSQDLFGSPSQNLYLAAGPSGSTYSWQESDGDTASNSLGANSALSDNGNGGNGVAPGFRITSNNPVGAIGEADGDGSEAQVFVTKNEFGTLFGSNEPVEYLSIVSDVSDANCTVYDNTGAVVGIDTNGVGLNGIYKYEFDVGVAARYAQSGWTLECSKPVWPYYEDDLTGDETNLLGHIQMRQNIYPYPTISIN